MLIKHYIIVITGAVKENALAFRALKEASNLGLNGKATYKTDQIVEISVEACSDSLKRFLSWCRSLHEDTGIAVTEVAESPRKYYTEFEINL